ncbi:MAG: YdcF family protein [Dokdonella sp.]
MPLAQFIDLFLSPLVLGFLLVLSLGLMRGRGWRWLRSITYVLVGVCLVLATPLGANTLLAVAESRAPSATACVTPLPTTVVLLAGGVRRKSADPVDVGALNEASVQRTLEAVALTQRLQDAQLVISGGVEKGAVAESTHMAELAVRLGLPRAAILTETTSLTTWENAQNVRALLPALPTRIWLVTSALHMPRSLLAFQAAGFTPCSDPADLRASAFEGIADLVPRGSAITKSEAVLHELVGEIVYRWQARTTADR